MELCSSAMARRMDEYTINDLGVPSVTLMERASGYIAARALELMGESANAAVFCGTGNNGGDGIGAAVMLIKSGKNARVFLTGEPGRLSHDSKVMAERLKSLGTEPELMSQSDNREIAEYLKTCGVVIDAIYGFGFHLPLKGLAKEAAELMNSCPAPVLAADIPSGVETDSGRADPSAVKADVTVTFSRAKFGQFITPGALFCGKVEVCDIGVVPPEDESFSVFAVADNDISLPKRRLDAHKGDFGRVLIIAGSTCYTGAPSFSSRAAVRTGAGLVFLGVPEAIYGIEAVKNDEAMVFPLPCDGAGRVTESASEDITERLKKCSVLLIGPGLGLSDDTFKVVYEAVSRSTVPVIIDADGITAVSANIDILDRASCPVILTPHDGEFARLGGDLVGQDRLTAARSFAEKHGVTLVLKGHRTISAFPDGTAYVNTTGNPGMAKGGSGDVLAGMMAALLAQIPDIKRAVTSAVYLHGKAGDFAAREFGEYSMTPSDVIDAIKYTTG